jgi:hypothetical protein
LYITGHICTSRLVNQDFFSVEPVNYFAKVFTNVMKKFFPSKSFAKDTFSHSEDSIEAKLVTAVEELKGSDCGDATEETEKVADAEHSDYEYESKFEVVKEHTKKLFEHDASLQTIAEAEVNVAQILLGAAAEYLSHIHLC